MNKYRLLKDLPHAKAGSIFTQENGDSDYYNTNFAFYIDRLHKDRVEDNPDWFEPVRDWASYYTLSEVVSSYKNSIKKEMEQKEAFVLNVIFPKLKWYHKLLFKVNKRFIRHVIVQIVCGNKWGCMIYGEKYWMETKEPI